MSWTPIKTSGKIPNYLSNNYALQYSEKSFLILWSDRNLVEMDINISLLDVVNFEWQELPLLTEKPHFRVGASAEWDKKEKKLLFIQEIKK